MWTHICVSFCDLFTLLVTSRICTESVIIRLISRSPFPLLHNLILQPTSFHFFSCYLSFSSFAYFFSFLHDSFPCISHFPLHISSPIFLRTSSSSLSSYSIVLSHLLLIYLRLFLFSLCFYFQYYYYYNCRSNKSDFIFCPVSLEHFKIYPFPSSCTQLCFRVFQYSCLNILVLK